MQFYWCQLDTDHERWIFEYQDYQPFAGVLQRDRFFFHWHLIRFVLHLLHRVDEKTDDNFHVSYTIVLILDPVHRKHMNNSCVQDKRTYYHCRDPDDNAIPIQTMENQDSFDDSHKRENHLSAYSNTVHYYSCIDILVLVSCIQMGTTHHVFFFAYASYEGV